MGNFFTALNDENISQTQLSTINQNCNQTASAIINDVTITAIDSHIGDITLSAALKVGNLTCVLDAVSSASTDAAVSNTSNAEIASLPFQLNANSIFAQNTTIISSFQQSVINQSCIQQAVVEAEDITLTFIDSSTGNIKIGAQADISSFSCNLQASSYQSAAASVKDSTTGKISSGCCIFDLGMLIPVVLGLVGLIALSKYIGRQNSKGTPGGGSGFSQEQANEALTASLSRDLIGPQGSASQQPVPPQYRQGSFGGARRSLPSSSSTEMKVMSR